MMKGERRFHLPIVSMSFSHSLQPIRSIEPIYGLKLLRRVCLRTGSFGLELQPESVGLSVNWTAGVRAELRSASLRAVWRVTRGEETSAFADLLRVEDIDEFELGETD